jgi:hypothetical protein
LVFGCTLALVRDDFPIPVKDELAKRVAFLCSRPACRRFTAGPKSGPSGTVNLGEAAHITAASPGGARYRADLSASERAAASNGIWLCPTCAALIDRDTDRYPEPKLREWKADAEAAAALALEDRRSPATESAGVLLEAERLMPALIGDMRADVRSDDTELVREFILPSNPNAAFSPGKTRFFYARNDHPGVLNQVDWLEEMGLVVNITTGTLPTYRMAAEFVEWLRRSE